MKNRVLFIMLFLMFNWLTTKPVYCQEYETGVFRIWLLNDDVRFSVDRSSDDELNTILNKYGVISIEQSFPWANRPENRRFYTIKFTGDDVAFVKELRSKAKHLIYPPYRFAISQVLYEPSDVLYDTIWHLKKIQADLAWDIERGNKDTKIAIIDTYYDPDHPDLSSQLLYDYDPYEPEIKYDSHSAMVFQNWHGTTVAGFAAGQTTDNTNTQPPGADYASIGFNNKIIPFIKNDELGRALFASTRMHADVISYTSIGSCEMSDSALLQAKSIIQEILDNGTVIVAGAGNGFCAGCYKNNNGIIKNTSGCEDPGDFVEFTPPYPFSPLIDSRIISVTGVTSGDSLSRRVYDTTTHQYKTSTWSYYDQVDVSSPGYDLWGLQTTLIRVIDTISLLDTVNHQPWVYYDTTYIERDHPFWNGYGGTSFATPIVAGLASLIKAHAPWLSAYEVEKIIKGNVDIVQDLELYRNPVTHKLRTGTGRINAFKALQEIENIAQNYLICNGTEVVWNDTVYIKDTLRICQGSTLRVQSDVFFRPSARVIVECGGKLIVDGGRLTGSLNHLWKGVLAYSNPDTMQSPFSQSTVVVQNGGIIENAETAIAAVQPGYDPDHPSYTKGGAIIIGNEGYFKNNIVALKLNPYKYYSFSRFNKCGFIIDKTELDYNIQPEKLVMLESVNGVQFKGCTFKNATSSPMGYGIYSFNSSFIVDDYCDGNILPCPEVNTTKSYFINLEYGVQDLGSGAITFSRIENSEFKSNKTGAYISGILGFKFNNNLINVREDSTGIAKSHYCGLYLDASTAYEVSDNTFYFPQGFQSNLNKIGIVVNNSGPENNLIYSNTFTNLTHGIHAQGENSSRDGLTGLEIKCNDFTDCKTDISVLAENSGIKYEQGSLGTLPTDAAGNHFSNLTIPGYWSIYNNASWINYNYHRCGLLSDLIPSKIYQVTPHMGWVEYSSASCPPIFGGDETKDQLVGSTNENKSQADSLFNELHLLVDLNNTPLLVNDVSMSTPTDSTLVYNELVEISPYVSDTVIFESIKKEDVFSNSNIHDLIKLNSHAAKSDKIINEIDNRQNYMPDSLYFSILSFADSVSGKEKLEGNIAAKLRDASRCFQTYYQRTKNDSTFAQGFLDTLDLTNLFEAKALKAAIYFNLKKFDSALNEMVILSNSDLANGYEQRCVDLLSFYSVCNQYGFDSIPDTLLLSLYDSTNKLSTAYYRNILINKGLINYQEPYLFSSETKSGKVRRNRVETLKVTPESCLRVYPNPTNNFLILEYVFPDKIETASIRILDIFGNVIKTLIMDGASGKRIVNLDNLSPGIYLLESLTNDKRKEIVKFTIIN